MTPYARATLICQRTWASVGSSLFARSSLESAPPNDSVQLGSCDAQEELPVGDDIEVQPQRYLSTPCHSPRHGQVAYICVPTKPAEALVARMKFKWSEAHSRPSCRATVSDSDGRLGLKQQPGAFRQRGQTHKLAMEITVHLQWSKASTSGWTMSTSCCASAKAT